jgi:ATP-dependent Clp protease adaptor protein ClpS
MAITERLDRLRRMIERAARDSQTGCAGAGIALCLVLARSLPIGNAMSKNIVKPRTAVRPKTKRPPLYKVILLNDDYTTMEFVVEILETVFQKSPAEAFRVMMQVHLNGSGVAGVYPWEVAETKVETVTSLARHAEFPLRATIEEE